MQCKKEQETDAFFAHSIVFDQNKSQSLTSRCAIREKFAHLYEWVVTKVIIQKSRRESSLWNRIWADFGLVGNTEKKIEPIMSNF